LAERSFSAEAMQLSARTFKEFITGDECPAVAVMDADELSTMRSLLLWPWLTCTEDSKWAAAWPSWNPALASSPFTMEWFWLPRPVFTYRVGEKTCDGENMSMSTD
jgi:hypothetical protein